MTRLVLFLVLIAVLTPSCRLPEGSVEDHESGAALVHWNQNLYVLGGRDETGTVRSEVWHVSVGADGSLGQWVRDPDLPQPRVGAASAAFGGMVYLFGGTTGSSLLKTVLLTLVKADGSLGFTQGWATNAISLPEPVSEPALAVVDGRVILAGGTGPLIETNSIMGARFRNDGSVGQWYPEPGSPSEQTAPFPSGAVVSQGLVWSVASISRHAPPRLVHKPAPARTPPPQVFPGSGYVNSGQRPRVTGTPGSTIRYVTAPFEATPADPSESSPAWPSTAPAVKAATAYALRAFGPDGPSETIVVRYRPLSSGLLPLLQKTITPGQAGEGSLTETYSGGSVKNVSTVTWRLSVASRTKLIVALDDASTLPTLSAEVQASLFEDDGLTTVRSIQGTELCNLPPGEYSMVLGEGTYLLVVRQIAGVAGGTFRLGSEVP